MKDIIYSLNTVLPVFLIIIFGYVLKKHNFIKEGFAASTTSIVYYFALPMQLFVDVSKSDFQSLLHVKFIVFIMAATFAVFMILWLLAVIFVKDKTKISGLVHAAFRGNYVYVGLPIAQNILGVSVVPSSILVVTFVLPLYNIFAIILLSYYNQNNRQNALKLITSVILNPMIVAIFLAIPFSVLEIKLPFAITKSFSYIGSLATPLALLLIGIGIRMNSFLKNMKYIISATVAKMLIIPLICVSLAITMGFTKEEVVVILVLFTTPSAMNAYIMTQKLGGDAELVSGIIMVTVAVSAFMIPFGTFILSIIGII